MKIIIGSILLFTSIVGFTQLTDQPKHELSGKVKRQTVLSAVSYIDGEYREHRQYYDSNETCKKAEWRFMKAVQTNGTPIVAICSKVMYA